ncbi:MAG: RHS repeat protein, partial [Planctomycetes bacterium]|nr:RHS repeat protein [Planctomycetota bacterium]
GNLIGFTDREGHTTTFSYDQPPFPHHLTGAEDPLGRPIVANVFDADGRVIAVCESLGDVDTLDGCATFEYDNVARTQTMFDANGNKSVLFFDERGNLVVEQRYTSATEFLETVRTFDANDKMTSETDPEGHAYTFEYDDRGNMVTMTNPAGHLWDFTYNDENDVILVCDPLGHCRSTVYDENRRVIERTDALGNSDTYTYYSNGRLETHTDPEGNVRQYFYTSQGYLTTIIEPDGTTTTMVRDGLGRITQKIDRNGRVSQYEWSAEDKLLTETWDTTPPEVFQYTWNAAGHMTSATDSGSALTLEYWPTGKLKSVQSSAVAGSTPWTISYTAVDGVDLVAGYDGNGNTTHVLDSFGGITEYQYDTLDRLVAIVQDAESAISRGVSVPVLPRRVDFEFDNGSLRLATRRYNDAAGTVPAIDTLFGYDCGACPTRITSIDHRRVSDDVSLDAMTFVRDARGTILESTDLEGLHLYTKDAQEALTSVVHSGAPGQVDESYSYDAIGNRTSSHRSSTYQLRYQSTPGGGGELLQDDSFVYQYDGEGNLVERTDLSDGSTTQYTFDHRNRLTGVEHFDAADTLIWSVSYGYDGIDRRIRAVESGVVRQYVYDRLNATLVLDAAGNVVKRNLVGHGLDDVYGYTDGTNGYWYLRDQKRSVRDIADTSGVVQRHYVYDTFGNVVGGSGTLVDDVRFQSREFSDLTGLGYFRARYYDPGTGRFIAPDQVMPHGYDIAVNNPTVFEDPTGKVSAIEWACEVVHSLGNVASAMKVTQPLANLYAEIVEAVLTLTPPPGGGGAAAERYRDAMIQATLEEIRDKAITDALGPTGGCAYTAAGLAGGGGGDGGSGPPGGGPGLGSGS